MTHSEYIKDRFLKSGIEISIEQSNMLSTYYDMLIEKNKVMNLTAITDFEEAVDKHFVDSASILKFVPEVCNSKCIDVGTGAGFPGLVLKIMCPNMKITLLDSLNKRLIFLQEVSQALKLDEIEFVHARAEDGGKNKLYREKYDYVFSRAVSRLSVLSELCAPFAKCGSFFVAYKSEKTDEEMQNAENALKILSLKLDNRYEFELPNNEGHRSILVFRKTKITPGKYPRKAGEPGKNPL